MIAYTRHRHCGSVHLELRSALWGALAHTWGNNESLSGCCLFGFEIGSVVMIEFAIVCEFASACDCDYATTCVCT